MSDTVTRSYLTGKLNKQIGVSLSECSSFVDQLFEEMSVALKEEEVAKIAFFGSFYVKSKSERLGRNPKTKIEAVISPRKVISFYSSSQLKNDIN